MKFSLLCFNTQGTPFFSPDLTLRYKKFCELINKDKPNIICFQEISTYYHLYLLKKYLNYPYFIYKKFLYAPKGGLVIVSKIPLEKVKFIEFKTHGSFNNVSFVSHIVKNGMLIAKIKNTDFTLINTHTFSDFEYEWSPTNKYYNIVKSQVEQLAQEINSQYHNDQPVLAVGDFNLKKNSRLYKFIINETRTSDIFADATVPTYFKERLDYKFKGKITTRIDFFFLKDQKKKIKVKTHGHLFNEKYTLANKKSSYLSDHIGLKAEFDMV